MKRMAIIKIWANWHQLQLTNLKIFGLNCSKCAMVFVPVCLLMSSTHLAFTCFVEESTCCYTAVVDQPDNGHFGLLCPNKRYSYWRPHEVQAIWSSQAFDLTHFTPQCDWSQYLPAYCHVCVDLHGKRLVWHCRWLWSWNLLYANSTQLYSVHNICVHAAV